MLVVEPRGSRYLSPFDGKPMASGWEAMIEDPNGADFREFVIFYHEAGDETFRLLNRKGDMLPQRDPHTDSYRPARACSITAVNRTARELSFRPLVGFADESHGVWVLYVWRSGHDGSSLIFRGSGHVPDGGWV